MPAARITDELAALRQADTPGRIDAMGRVMRALYCQPRTHSVVGGQIGLSRQRVRQIERRALRHLAEGLLRQIPA